MRKAILIAVVLAGLVAAGCVPLPSQLSTAVPTTAATQASATAQPATATAPVATQTAATATVPAVEATPTIGVGAENLATFKSPQLGITFNYPTALGGQKVGLLEQPDRVYVYVGNITPTDGQWVQVFRKPANQSLVDAIKTQVLKGYSPEDCIATDVANPETGQQWPASFSFARIELPRAANDDMETLQAKAAKCPQPYAAIGGLAYFVADSRHPDRFAFFSIGQYGIPVSEGRLWQTTLRFLDETAQVTPEPTNVAGGYYTDDRSSAERVLVSYFNAINYFDYSRAYSYWNAAAGRQNGLPAFQQFREGYANTKSVKLTVGDVTSDVGAGQLYYWAPVTLLAQTNDGATQTFVGCYKLHLARPGFQAVPPFNPLAIESASVKQVDNNADTKSLMAAACEGGGQPMGSTPTPRPDDISASRYLDDRSDGVQVLRSLFNAINSKEYVRAYSYWESNATQLPPFDKFEAGYANTETVGLAVGTVIPDAGAGNVYYNVPVVLTATNSDGSKQTFAGCYTLHMVNPGMQTEPPFTPLGIRSASVRQVANDSDTQQLLSTACNR